MDRLPKTRKETDSGCVYVVKRGDAYKIGARPAILESLIHQRFADKRTEGPNFKREWFALTNADLDWLRGLERFMAATV
jgi:hypothetical protein